MSDDQVDRLLTVDEVAAWFRVPPSWVYSRTRVRGKQRLPFIEVGKYVRFDPVELRAFLGPPAGAAPIMTTGFDTIRRRELRH